VSLTLITDLQGSLGKYASNSGDEQPNALRTAMTTILVMKNDSHNNTRKQAAKIVC
jgi:hypothetical protein